MSKDNKKIFHFSFVFYVRDAFLSDSNKQQLEKKKSTCNPFIDPFMFSSPIYVKHHLNWPPKMASTLISSSEKEKAW